MARECAKNGVSDATGEFRRAYASTNRRRTWKSDLARSYAQPNHTSKSYEFQVSISFDKLRACARPDRSFDSLFRGRSQDHPPARHFATAHHRLFNALGPPQSWDGIFVWNSPRPVGLRTAMLLRCLAQESPRIRLAAKRRGVTISAFVIHTLRSSSNLPLQPSLSPKRPASKQKAKE